LPSEEWLNEINKHIDDKTDFIAGYSPLIYKRPSIIDTFKSFERMSIFALTSASFGHNIPMTCTARNMVYRKSNFINAGGFSKIGHIKSGDDDLMLLLQRKLTNKHSFMFSQNSIVPSIEDKTISEHHQQEIRRASKLKYYPAYLKTIVLSVAIFYFLLLLLFLFSVLGLAKWNIFLVVFLIKTIADAALIITWQIKMKLYNSILLLPFMELFYIPYFLFYGLKGTFGAYKWKN
ncbi:MAG TPA: hypothetical protein PLH63_07720, partial [Candidatus Cloacimonadota bacterium]|nr:hypothetical protein [Candidatus Cloacimonadota bacterium]